MILEVKSTSGKENVHLQKSVIVNVDILRKFYHHMEYKEGISALARLEVYSPAVKVAMGAKQVERYLRG